MKNIKATEILDNKSMRDEMIDRAVVLDRVKTLLLIPKLEVMTTRQVAEYYEVDVEAIQKTYQRHKEEINLDGVVIMDSKIWNGHLVQSKSHKAGASAFQDGEGNTYYINNRGEKCFSKRAILRIGMLLRDSKIAQEVRTQLLNVVEKAEVNQIVLDFNKENELIIYLGRACVMGIKEKVIGASRAYNVFKDRHISQLNEAISDLKTNNKILAAEILTWGNCSILNKAVRTIALSSDNYVGSIWNELYSELQYKHHIDLKKREESPCLNYIKESEWIYVQQSLVAIAEKYNVDISKIVEDHSAERLEGCSC